MGSLPGLARDTLLHRASSMRLNLNSSGEATITIGGTSFAVGPHTLAILDEFSRPRTIAEALEKLRTRTSGVQDWIDLTSTIMHLHQAGVLLDETGEGPSFGRAGYEHHDVHVRMLNDRQRTSRYLAAIREVVRPDDVVVDIGTGSGILAAAAAAAGARHVYAIEATSVGSIARAVFNDNGLADRVTLMQGWSTQVTLPERADVLVSEMIGSEALSERVLEVTADAVKRLLKPEARMVPARIRIFGLPMAVPRARLARNSVTSATVRRWRSWYGLDLGAVVTAPRAPTLSYVKPQDARRWKTFSEPVMLADIDLKTNASPVVDSSVTVVASASGQITGIVTYFTLDLGPTVQLSTDPYQVSRDNHWTSSLWHLDVPISVRAGDRFTVSYRRSTKDRTSGVSVTRE